MSGRFAAVIVLVSCFGLAVIERGAASQDKGVTAIAESSRCTSCRVTVRVIAALGSPDGDGAIEEIPFDVRVDANNRYWVSPRTRPPMLYDSAGRFLRLVGRQGSGPGEFMGPAYPRFSSGDSVIVLDPRQARISVLNTDLTFVRSLSGQIQGYRTYELVGRTIVATGLYRTPDAAGYPLHLLTVEGNVVARTKSFGPAGEDGTPLESHLYGWKLAPVNGNSFWSADVGRYRLIRWSLDGSSQRVVVRTPDWFKGPSTARPRSRTIPPDPMMQAIAVDSEGLLWVAALVASPTWTQGWNVPRIPPSRSGVGRASSDAPSGGLDYLKLYQTNLDVIDPEAPQIVASLSMSEHVVAFLPGRRAAVYSEDANGEPRLHIVQFSLVRR